MGCPSSCLLGEDLVFSITTHDPDTGVLTDADAPPPYRVYEEETGTPLLTGTMSKLDDASTTGFYTESIAITQANGFESGKTYTIYIEAVVDSDTGGISYSFRVEPIVSSSAETKVLTDSLALTDTDAVMAISITLVDSIVSVELTDLGGSPTLSDTILLVEDLKFGRHLTLTDGIGLTEATPVYGTSPTLEDGVALVETVTKTIKSILTDTIVLTEPQLQAIANALVEVLDLTDTVSMSITMTLTDTLELVELILGPPRAMLDLRTSFRQHLLLSSSFRQHLLIESHLTGGDI